MLRKIVALLALFAALFPGCAFADTSDEPLVIGAKAAILMEAETGRVLLEKNADQRLPMASTTKIMTCLLALENSSLEENVTAGKNAAGVTGTSLYLSQGETLTMEQMLYGLMLRSGNDAAVAIAEHVDGSVEEFVARMNRRAVELGADAQFKNPHGLDQQGHEASARAMALILRECLKNETFARITSTREKVIPWPGNEYSRVLKNKNRLLTSYEGATGGKTGYTSGAGRCLVFSAERNGMRLVGCVPNCPTWFDTAQAMLDYGFEHYSMQEVSRAGDSMGQAAVTGGQKDRPRFRRRRTCGFLWEWGKRSWFKRSCPMMRRLPCAGETRPECIRCAPAGSSWPRANWSTGKASRKITWRARWSGW